MLTFYLDKELISVGSCEKDGGKETDMERRKEIIGHTCRMCSFKLRYDETAASVKSQDLSDHRRGPIQVHERPLNRDSPERQPVIQERGMITEESCKGNGSIQQCCVQTFLETGDNPTVGGNLNSTLWFEDEEKLKDVINWQKTTLTVLSL